MIPPRKKSTKPDWLPKATIKTRPLSHTLSPPPLISPTFAFLHISVPITTLSWHKPTLSALSSTHQPITPSMHIFHLACKKSLVISSCSSKELTVPAKVPSYGNNTPTCSFNVSASLSIRIPTTFLSNTIPMAPKWLYTEVLTISSPHTHPITLPI